MIGTMQIRCNAAHPQMALPTVCTYATSPSSIRVLEVPKKIGKWQITEVSLKALYPDGSIVAAPCVLVGGVWVGTLEGTTATGTVKNGFTVTANGEDENGSNVRGYVLGVGDIKVLELNANAEPDPPRTFIKLYSSIPDQLQNGDAWIDDNGRFSVQAEDDVVKSATVQEVNEVASNLETKADKPATFTEGNFAEFDSNGNPVDSHKKPSDFADAENTYTKVETDKAIDRVAAYYITRNVAGDAFETKAQLNSATVFYSGGEVRVPTRNDYAVVLADETHGGAEYRYIYGAPEGATEGQWEAQYPIETNDYAGLANKPQINGHELSGNQTGAALGLANLTALPYSLGAVITSSAQLADRTANYIAPTSGTASIALTFPPDENSKARDFLALVAPGASFGGSISFTAPTGATIYGDGFGATVTPGESWLFAITEIATNQFYTRAIKMEVPA